MTGGRRRTAFLAVARDPTLGRVALAFLAFSAGEWGTWIAMVVYAYGRGGAQEAAVVSAVALVPSLLVAPTASLLGDRLPRGIVLLGTYLAQGGSMLLVAGAMILGAPSLLVYALATATATAVTLTRPVQAAWLPEIVATTDELVAANIVSGAIEAAGTLLGPGLASLLMALSGPDLVFAAAGLSVLASSAGLAPIVRRARALAATTAQPLELADRERVGSISSRPSLLAVVRGDLREGLAAIRDDPGLRAIAAATAARGFLIGAFDIFFALLAIDILGLGTQGVGLLEAAGGIGALLGTVMALALVGRRGLAPAVIAGGVVYGGGLVAIGIVLPPAAGVAVLIGLGGAGAVVLAVANQTITQRVAPQHAITRVFGVFEATIMGCTAIGSLAVPALIGIAGPSGAMVGAGLIGMAVIAIQAPTLRAAERRHVVPLERAAALRAVPMLGLLSPPVLERLAGSLVPLRVDAGTPVIREGEVGDRFYVIIAGHAAVTIGGRRVRTQGPGDSFGEIALLRDIPRTATVTAEERLELYALERVPFLEAVTGVPQSHAVAAALVAERLGAGQ